MKHPLILCSTCVVALALAAPAAQAETVYTKTKVQTQDLPDVNEVSFSEFDVNEDGSYSMEEVGERLFTIFDTDGNEMIDNTEWSAKTFTTVTPMEKETFRYVDSDEDGEVEEATYTYETFYKESGLMKFDANKNGLSASEFIKTGYQELDSDQDNLISLEEWKTGYIEGLPKHAKTESYN